MRGEHLAQRPVLAGVSLERRHEPGIGEGGQAARAQARLFGRGVLEAVEDLLGPVLRRLHVGLVEGVDLEQEARGRGGDLPQQELRAEVEVIVELEAQHGVARLLERGQRRVDGRLRPALQGQAHERPVSMIRGRRAERLARDGKNAVAFLARGLRHELLDPEAECFERRRQHEGQLVAAVPGVAADERAQAQGRVGSRRRLRREGPRGLACAGEEFPCVDAG